MLFDGVRYCAIQLRCGGYLGQINAMLHGIHRVAENPEHTAEHSDLAGMMMNVKELTRIAEMEINAVTLSCVRARREALKQAAR